jgi:hypothetical protein
MRRRRKVAAQSTARATWRRTEVGSPPSIGDLAGTDVGLMRAGASPEGGREGDLRRRLEARCAAELCILALRMIPISLACYAFVVCTSLAMVWRLLVRCGVLS